jgi:hypothetical protein
MLFISIFAMLAAISISSVAAYYSILGLTAIFPASVISIIIMGAVLEVGKLASAIWLHTFWHKAPFLLKSYLTTAVIILMFITSLGIFGFLSKSHIEHTSSLSSNTVIIQNIDSQITREEQRIDSVIQVLTQMDNAVNVLTEAQRIRGPDGALAVREAQREEREQITTQIEESSQRIQDLINRRSELEIEQALVEAEVGPIRYIAEMVYGPNPDNSLLEEAVRWLIILIVVVFDPLAITLVLASIYGFNLRKEQNVSMVTKEIIIEKKPRKPYTKPKEKPVLSEEIVIKKDEPKKPIIEKTQENKEHKSSGWLGKK